MAYTVEDFAASLRYINTQDPDVLRAAKLGAIGGIAEVALQSLRAGFVDMAIEWLDEVEAISQWAPPEPKENGT